MNTYADAAVTFATAKDKDKGKGKPLGSSTRLHKRGESYAVQYHDTDVVTFTPDGSIALNTGGWLTMTTRSRISEYLPAGYYLTSVKGRWYLRTPDALVPFRDGLVLHADGSLSGAEAPEVVAVQDAENRATDKAVKKYVAGLTPEVIATGFEQQGGDCFGCLAPSAFDVSHLALHVEEGYYPLHMLANALSDKGYRPEVYLSAAARGEDWMVRQVRKIVAGYLRNALYTGAVAVAHGRKPVGAHKAVWQRAS